MTAAIEQPGIEPAEPRAPHRRLFRKYLASFVTVTAVALITSVSIDGWFSYLEQKRLLIGLQRQQADAAAATIGQFVDEIRHELGWISQLPPGTVTSIDPRIDAIRVMRLNPAVAEIAVLNPSGREQLRVSRRVRDVIGSQNDLSASDPFLIAKANGAYYGPVYFFGETEPFMTLAIAGEGKDPIVIVAEVNLRFVWEVVSRIKVGQGGAAYVVDRRGLLVAHPDLRQVLRRSDLSAQPQVRDALSGATAVAGEVVDDLSGRTVLSAYSTVPAMGWPVFVQLPIGEAYASIYASVGRSAFLLVVLLGCAVVAALLFSRRMTGPISALAEGAARIGGGHLDQRISIKTGDELEGLGDQFNRMAARLQESYATLEQRVVARTAELAQARDQAMSEHAEAVRARKMAETANEAKSRFLAVISHEIRTPLNGVLGVLQLFQGNELAPDRRHLLINAMTSGETLIALIDGVLDYARLEAGTETVELRAFDVRRHIEATAGLMRPQIEAKGLAFQSSVAIPENTIVNGDPAKLTRILFNLLSNAIKFTPEGTIHLNAALTADSAGNELLIMTVTDSGIGIAPDMQERIFADFTQADDSIARRFGGTGLGLAISRRLAVLMSGTLTVDSRLGAGSTFRLELPVIRGESIQPLPDTDYMPHALSILVVDDDPINREVADAMLRKLGHHATVAVDGKAAIAFCRQSTFDVVLMDIRMPGMNGFDTSAAILALESERKPRIIALTADISKDTQARMQQSGIGAMLGKPILLEALRRAIDAVEDETPRSSPPKPPELIDGVYLSTQAELLGITRVRELRQLFTDIAAGHMRDVERATAEADHDALRRAVHQLGSAAAALALADLFARCNRIERDIRSGTVDIAIVDELSTLQRRSLDALDAELARLQDRSEALS